MNERVSVFVDLPGVEARLFWAVVTYARWWLSTDAPFLAAVEDDGRLTPVMASKIMTNYNVARGFEAGKTAAFHAAIDAANQCATTWPADFIERYRACSELAERWKAMGATKKLQISAATKLMWFLRPLDWTMFDRLARLGMGAKSAQEFYEALDDGSFLESVAKLQAIIGTSGWKSLPATKVIDFFLMLRGDESWSTASSQGRAFLTALPKPAADDLIGMSWRAQVQMGSDFLPSIMRKRANCRSSS